jgi:diaminopimelate decarboxylase
MKPAFYYSSGRLFCEKVDLPELAGNMPTPFYLYSFMELKKNCQEIMEAGKSFDYLPCYALKANYNPHLLRLIAGLGLGADVVSAGELYFALKAGFPPSKIVFAGVGKTAQEIKFAIETGIHSLNVESFEELKLTSNIAGQFQKKVDIAIRINPDIEAQTHDYISTGMHNTKFGVSADEALPMYQFAIEDKYLEPRGVHVHIGSQIISSEPYLKTIDFLQAFIKKLKNLGVQLSFIDLGGGIGINYHDNLQDSDSNRTYIQSILPDYLNGFKGLGLELVVELGRAVIGSAGILISNIIYRKQTPLKKFLIVDAAMNNLIRPSLYGAHHEIVPLQLNHGETETVDIVGPVCESGDFLAKEQVLQMTKSGDYLAILGTGAYGQALSSNYNLRPRIGEYLVGGQTVKTIFKEEKITNLWEHFKS